MTLDRRILKWIATITMLIDHIAAGFYYNGIQFTTQRNYNIMRGIGRIAFPLYCLMFVEGYIKTSSKKKYFIRLLLFAVITEIPYDLLFSQQAFYWYNQNIMWLFVISILGLQILDKTTEYIGKQIIRTTEIDKKEKEKKILEIVLGIGIIYLLGRLADKMYIDYGKNGVYAIGLLYLFRENRILQALTIIPSFYFEKDNLYGIVYLTAPLINLYDRVKKVNMSQFEKIFFYVFYPAHIIVILCLVKIISI